jgi:putative FmdB family regulatory protein
MPLYEYYCTDCRTKFEALRPMDKADASIQCKNCESVRTSRALSLFAAHRKVGGGSATSTERFGGSMAGGGCCGGMCGCGH